MLARYAVDGLPVWTRSVADGVTPTALTLTGLGNVLLVGSYTGTPDLGTGALPASGEGVPALFIAKYSPTGRPLWSRGFVATFQRFELEHWPVRATAVTTDAAGSLILTGHLQGRVDLGGGVLDAGGSSVEFDDAAAGALVAKFDFDGRHLWSRVVLGFVTRSAVPGRGHG